VRGKGTVVFIGRGAKKKGIGRRGTKQERVVEVIHFHGKCTERENSRQVTGHVHERADTGQSRETRNEINLRDETTEDELNSEQERKVEREAYINSNILIPSQTSCVTVIGRAKKVSERNECSPATVPTAIVFTRKVIIKHCNYFLWIFTIAMVLYDYHYHK
jgi:hypothetical protein